LDTEVYSNTGGQASKSTPMGAVAKFAAGGKPSMKKDLGMISMTYGNIYVATVALGASPSQCVKAMSEAQDYDGPALVLAYSHCIAHGIDMSCGMQEHKDAVASGHWPLYRYNPELAAQGKNPLTLDSKPPTMKFSEHAMKENRFRVLRQTNPEQADALMAKADKLVLAKYDLLCKLAGLPPCSGQVAAPAQKP
jgi:pyruvate-ferredoxin/flavodoxin oxidoreductase